MSLPPGTVLGSYRIVAELGSGGMGQVYRAHDGRLGRDVAVKVLPEGFADDPERLRRFQLEARTLAALSHPNVVQVFDAGEQGGRPYLVMELLEGETLRQRMGRGRLPWRQAVAWAAAIADGLAAAHAKGIVHRDLKPENVVLTAHGLKILDFGLAKLHPVAIGSAATVDTDPAETLAGALLGTVGYMAPEQVRGLPVDGRSDIFALGCVLYELVTGTRAFGRASTLETLAAILNEPVPEASASGSGALPELDRILSHCLEKSPGDRFQNSQDLAFALHSLLGQVPAGAAALPVPRRRWRSAAAALLAVALGAALLVRSPWQAKAPPYDPRCVAILPLENRTGEPALDNLGQQAVDQIRKMLQPAMNLRVADDPVRAPGAAATPLGLAQATRARYVAAGTCYLKGDQLEFQGRLLDPWNGRVVYTLGPWRGPRNDPAQPLEDLAQTLCGAIVWSYNEYRGFEPGLTRPPRFEAYQAFIHALDFYGRDNPKAIPILEHAVALDPGFLWARVHLVFACGAIGDHARAAAEVARMEAGLEACTVMERCIVRWIKGDQEGRWQDALTAFEIIRTLQPDSPVIRFNRGFHYLDVNRPGSAIRDLDGLSPHWGGAGAALDYWAADVRCEARHVAGDFKGELRDAREAEKLFPDVLEFRAHEAAALAALGRAEAIGAVLAGLDAVTPRPDSMTPTDVREDAVLELCAHNRTEAARRLAAEALAAFLAQPLAAQKLQQRSRFNLLVALGRMAEALDMARAQVAERPDDHLWQAAAASALARLGRPEEARKLDEGLAARVVPYSRGAVSFERAGIAAQLGEKDRAVALLRQAFAEGRRFGTGPHKNLDLEPLRGYPPYEELMKPRD